MEYWPSALGLVLACAVGYWLWPSDEGAGLQVDPGQPIALPDRASETESVGDQEEEQDAQRYPSFDDEEENESAQAPRYEYREVLRPVERQPEPIVQEKTWTQDDPEVKDALAQLKIDVYGSDEDEALERTEAFLKENGVNFERGDLDQGMTREKLRRMGADVQGLTAVIDGELVKDVSPEALQQALTEAVKRRMEE